MVFVTHDQAEAMSMGDRMIALNAGEILQEGTPEQIYRHPGTPFIARQLGQPPINLFETQEKDGYWITSEGKRLCPASGERTGRATLGIRPEDIRHQGGELPGEVLLVERMGPVNLLLVAWAGVEIRMMVSKSHRIETGDRVFPAMDPEKIRIWHKEA
jgi:ABC-type sugar transport system ATPase subunit